MNDKILQAVLSAKQDKNIKFTDLRTLLMQLGFNERIKGDHFIYKAQGLPERVNIQPDGNMAKTYQVRQIRSIIKHYNLGGDDND
ncbi:MAG: type II toxin-antitoxin system HicA family toxin [Oscillospiraceae bacterium]|nr:type II toxin-antitoxin system HicA family toxin [Oscillospiraceae bacterium]